MTINPTLPPTVAEFRAMFPEFSEVGDEQVTLYLDIAMQWIDVFWFQPDAKIAVMWAAAHYLALHDQASGGEITSSGSGVGGGVGGGGVDPELGKIWIKSVRFRDRQVTYDRVSLDSQKAASGGSEHPHPAAEFWEATPYGEMYLSFQRRNVPHIAVI